MAQKYYLLRTRNVKPRSPDYPLDTTYRISLTPGRTNRSGEPVEDGWLGTTNDIAEYADGGFDTFEAALAAIPDEFYTAHADPNDETTWGFRSKKAVARDGRRRRARDREFLRQMEAKGRDY